MTAILLTKGKAWEKEQEWRAFRPLNQAAEKIDADPYPVYLFDVPMECVRSVTFGARMDEKQKDLLRWTIQQESACAHIRLFQASLDDKTFSLRFTPQS